MIHEPDVGRPDSPSPILPGDTPEVVTKIRRRFEVVAQLESIQRREEEEDLRFADIDQWTKQARDAREGGNTESGLEYSKPTLVLDLLHTAIEQRLTDARDSKLGVSLSSRAAKPSRSTFYLERLVEKRQRESDATNARMSGFTRAMKCGRGFYQLRVHYVDEAPVPDVSMFDQDVSIHRIKDQSTVYFDPNAQEQDKSDARWCIHTFMLGLEDRKLRWPGKPIITEGAEFEDWASTDHQWYESTDQKERRIRIAYYYEKSAKTTKLVYHPDHGAFTEASMPPELKALVDAKDGLVRVRMSTSEQIHLTVTDGIQELESVPYAGEDFPYIPVIGWEAYAEGIERHRGLVSFVKDPCRAVNTMFSAAVQVLSQPVSLLMADEQSDDHEDEHETLWLHARTTIKYKPQLVVGTGGQAQLAPPPAPISMLPSIEHLVVMIQQTRDIISHLTGNPEFTTNANAARERSALAVEQQSQQGTRSMSMFLDQLATISLRKEGKCLVDLLIKLYDRPGRVVWVPGVLDGREAPILIKQPFFRDHTGKATPVPHAACGGTGLLVDPMTGAKTTDAACHGTGIAPKDEAPETWQEHVVEYVDFAESRHAVDIAIGRQEESRRRERLQSLLAMLTGAPDYTPFFLADIFRELNLPRVADRLESKLPEAQDDAAAFSPQAKQAIAEKDQQLQQLQEAVQNLSKVIETQEIIKQGKLETVRAKGEIDIQRDVLKQQAELAKIGVEAETAMSHEGMAADKAEALERVRQAFALVIKSLDIDSRERIAGAADATAASRTAIDAETRREIADVAAKKAELTAGQKPAQN